MKYRLFLFQVCKYKAFSILHFFLFFLRRYFFLNWEFFPRRYLRSDLYQLIVSRFLILFRSFSRNFSLCLASHVFLKLLIGLGLYARASPYHCYRLLGESPKIIQGDPLRVCQKTYLLVNAQYSLDEYFVYTKNKKKRSYKTLFGLQHSYTNCWNWWSFLDIITWFEPI